MRLGEGAIDMNFARCAPPGEINPSILRRLQIRTGLWPGKRVARGSLVMKLDGGDEAPGIFWCLQTGEEAAYLQELAASFKQSFYIFSSPAHLDAPSDDFNDASEELVTAIGARYVTEIKNIQEHGPYFLAGHCAGAETAYEIARQLMLSGSEVKLLLLIEPIQSFEVKGKMHAFAGWAFITFGSIYSGIGKIWSAPFREYSVRILNSLRKLFNHNRKERYIPSVVDHHLTSDEKKSAQSGLSRGKYCFVRRPEGVGVFPGDLDDYATTYGRPYRFPPYPGRVSLIFGRSSQFAFQRVGVLRPYIDLFWKQRALGGLDVAVISGDHVIIGTEEFGRTVVDCIARSMAQ